jgi:hypothetical protein
MKKVAGFAGAGMAAAALVGVAACGGTTTAASSSGGGSGTTTTHNSSSGPETVKVGGSISRKDSAGNPLETIKIDSIKRISCDTGMGFSDSSHAVELKVTVKTNKNAKSDELFDAFNPTELQEKLPNGKTKANIGGVTCEDSNGNLKAGSDQPTQFNPGQTYEYSVALKDYGKDKGTLLYNPNYGRGVKVPFNLSKSS